MEERIRVSHVVRWCHQPRMGAVNTSFLPTLGCDKWWLHVELCGVYISQVRAAPLRLSRIVRRALVRAVSFVWDMAASDADF